MERKGQLETVRLEDSKHKPRALLDPSTQKRFINDLPIPKVIDATKGGSYTLEIRETYQWLGLTDKNGSPLATTVWGFGQPGQDTSYPGPTILAHQGVPISVDWENELPIGDHLLPLDRSLLTEQAEQGLPAGHIPTVVHLHGGHTDSSSDGLPDAWFTQNDAETGPAFQTGVAEYNNDQQAATLWYHDHVYGMTRLNVYAGMAGFYLLRDRNEDSLIDKHVLPGGDNEVGVAIQDRSFTSDGQLFYPAFADDPVPGTDVTVAEDLGPDFRGQYPTARPEFFGDVILANGMAWPKHDVDPGQYRVRLLNGSDSRFYVLRFSDSHVKATLVGTDGGLLPKAVTVMDGDGVQEQNEQIVLAPGDRADLVVDFSDCHLRGEQVTLQNVGPAFDPFAGLNADGSLAEDLQAADPAKDPVGAVMRFDVADKAPIHNACLTDGTELNPGFRAFTAADADKTRKLGLFEGKDDEGRVEPVLGVAEATTDVDGNPVPFGPLDYDAPITETPRLGSTEVWEIYNFTADAHPIHLHQVQFQVLDKQHIHFDDANEDGIPDDTNGDKTITIGADTSANDVFLLGDDPLRPEETGWQDTAWVPPGEVMRIATTFDLPGDYVWHCHILSHEDHDMMRPYRVVEDAASGFSTTALGTGGFSDMVRPTGAFDGWPGPWSAG